MSGVHLISACRSPVGTRGGAFATVEAHDLAAPVLRACLKEAGLAPHYLDYVVMGNALSGGGNVARLAALAAGLPEEIPSLTLDTQCCAGLDAILLAMRLVQSGAARAVLAGGVESFSRAPIRARRPKLAGEAPQPYDRPAFAPWPDRDPDPLDAMAALAVREDLTRDRQAGLALASHARARGALARLAGEIVPVARVREDSFTRELTVSLCLRAPVVAGEGRHALDATTVAVEADAAAAVLVVDTRWTEALRRPGCAIAGGATVGGRPEEPFGALVPAVARLFGETGIAGIDDIAVVELMESSAVQFAVALEELGADRGRVNRGGGALARGHPIGASGAILAVRLFHELLREQPGALGLAAIAAAGGLGTALMLRRS